LITLSKLKDNKLLSKLFKFNLFFKKFYKIFKLTWSNKDIKTHATKAVSLLLRNTSIGWLSLVQTTMLSCKVNWEEQLLALQGLEWEIKLREKLRKHSNFTSNIILKCRLELQKLKRFWHSSRIELKVFITLEWPNLKFLRTHGTSFLVKSINVTKIKSGVQLPRNYSENWYG